MKKQKTINRFLIAFHVYCIIFTMVVFFLGGPYEWTYNDVGFIAICIGVCIGESLLFYNFRRQIVNIIPVEGNRIGMLMGGGKYVEVNRGDVTYIREQTNRYQILLRDGKKYSAYKYMPPYSIFYKEYIEKQIKEICRVYGISVHYE